MKYPSVKNLLSACGARLGVLGLISLAALNLSAAPLRTSQIVGFTTGSLGSVGGTEGWAGSSGNYTVTNGSGSLNGVTLGLYPSAGDKVNLSYSSTVNSPNTYNGFASVNGQFAAPTNLYYSFLFNFNTTTNMSTTASNKICQVNRNGSSSGVHFEVHAILNGTGQIKIGVMKPGGTPVYSTTTVSAGQTFFVVLREQMLLGNGNDTIDLWINPAPAAFGVGEGSIPSPDASTFDGIEDSSTTGPGRFYIFAGVSALFDEFRMSTSWADVTPSASSCTPASFATNPTNTTVTEGISATFSVSSSSSSPLYQWQVSTNGGTTWQNVTTGVGGTSPNYSTAPLATTDSGQSYRAIATVSCGGGSSATSSVAVVTVNAATATALGVVVDDRFDDNDRTNAPIAISNSVWYASAAASLDATSGDLVGAPGSGTSRLWLGYFTPDTNQPVHLAVGRAIKASLTFTASGIQGTGANSLRFGLYDYADGGARVTDDAFGSGSTGNGANVRGYMLTLNFGTTFSVNTPLQLSARSGITDLNLMGASGDYDTLASGPTGATLANAPAFTDGTVYILDLLIERVGAATVNFTATVTGGGTNYTATVQDSAYAYPRFDAIGIRPEALETTANAFTFSRVLVQVVNATPPPIPLNISSSGGNVTLTWTNSQFSLQASPSLTGTFTNVPGAVTGYTVPASGQPLFYRLKY